MSSFSWRVLQRNFVIILNLSKTFSFSLNSSMTTESMIEKATSLDIVDLLAPSTEVTITIELYSEQVKKHAFV
jgi:hypothetical protein